jgi:hypothetical protein
MSGMMNKGIVSESKDGRFKIFRSTRYNYNFDKLSGEFARWGQTKEEDPTWSPFGPEIMDIEISEGESCPMTCAFCYKGNKKGDASKSLHMSLATFKQLFATFPKTVTQIAFGITSVGAHPELFDIFQYSRDNGVIPNVTINGADPLTDEQVQKLITVCGAMAISVNKQNFDSGLNLIDKLTSNGGKQINIHYVISKQSIEFAYTLAEAIKNDPRLAKMNAIVFLGLKPKERGQAFDVLEIDEYVKLVNYCLTNDIRFGFDSCSAARFDKAVSLLTPQYRKQRRNERRKKYLKSKERTRRALRKQQRLLLQCSERCESGLFSAYLDCAGKYWHCSFGENLNVAYGIDVTKVTNFAKEVWCSEPMNQWRKTLLGLDRECPLYSQIHVEPREPFAREIEKEQREMAAAKEKLTA